jgi:putative ABC transport system substrate-binding protein
MICLRTFAVAACLALSLSAIAQQPSMPAVGVLALGVEGRAARVREGLHNLGYVEGRNIRIEERVVDDRYARLPDITAELVRLKMNVVVAIGNSATVAMSRATSTIPIVMVAGVDPVKEKLAASLSHPRGNVTGITTIVQDLVPKRLELVKDAMPGIARVGIVWNPASRGSTNSLARAQAAANSLKLQLHVVEARTTSDFDKAFGLLVESRTSVFVLMAAGMFTANRVQFLESAARNRLAGIYSAREWGEGGGLITYGPDLFEAERRAAFYVDKILKGAKPGDLPIEQPTKLELVVNLRTAKTLGIKLPQTILVRADRVIE